MLDNTNTPDAGMMSGQHYMEGTPVFDAAGEKVGAVSEHNVQGGYLVVHKGWLFPRDVYVPLSAIGRGDGDGVYLNMYKDELKNQDWDNPPTNAGANGMTDKNDMNSGSSMRSTSAADAAQTPGAALDMGQPGAHQTPVRDGDVAVPVREEEMIARKTPQQEAGRVHVHKDVVEEPQSLEVPVTREEVTVERVPVQGSGRDIGPDAFQGRDIEVPVMGEEVTAEKRARVGEEIHLHKQQVTEQQHFGDTVRKERVNIEEQDQQGDVPLAGSGEQPPTNP